MRRDNRDERLSDSPSDRALSRHARGSFDLGRACGPRKPLCGRILSGRPQPQGLCARHDPRRHLRLRLLVCIRSGPCVAARTRLGGLRRPADHRRLSHSGRGREEDGRRLPSRRGSDRHRHDPRALRQRERRTRACGAPCRPDARLLHDDDDRAVHRRGADFFKGRGRELRLGAFPFRCRDGFLHGFRRLQGCGRHRHGLCCADARGDGRTRLEHPGDGRRP